MNNYIIRFANQNDTSSIMQFINDFWRANHILARNRELFDWQYLSDNKLHFVLGVDNDNQIQGLIGYIAYDVGDKKDIALALWKSNPGCGYLGVQILMYLIKNEPHREIVCTGINMRTTELVYRKLGFSIGKMKQWYRLSPRECYHIASVKDSFIPPIHYSADLDFVRCNSIDELPTELFSDTSCIPYKSKDYFERRYFDHPIYKYLVYRSHNNNTRSDSVVVLRKEQVDGNCVVRLIDYIGVPADFALLTSELDHLVKQYDAEYIDMYEFGLSDAELINAGWLCVDERENIIPNYFSPFEEKNIEIYCSTTNNKALLFRGDGDQDRPN